MKGKATISDVANYAGVSKSTVSNFLNGKYERMTKDTKNKITEAIRELEYVPSLSARRLSAKNVSKTICLVIPGNMFHLCDAMYYPTVFRAVGKIAEEEGYNVLLYTRGSRDKNSEEEYLKSLAQSLVDGFIIFDLEKNDLYFKEFEKIGIPYICVGKILDYEDYPYVASDHEKSMKDMLEYLYRLNHKKIGIIGEDENSVVEITRAHAVEVFLHDKQDPALECQYIHITQKTNEMEIFRYCQQMFQGSEIPDAVIVSSTFLFLCVQAITGRGLNIPGDVSIIVFEHYKQNRNSGDKNFTRVESKAEQISRLAFRKLLDQIMNPGEKIVSHLEPLDFIEGETTVRAGNVNS